MNFKSVAHVYLCLIMLALTACATKPIPTQPPQSAGEYLSNALDWIETHSLKINTVDWATVREQALALAPNPQTTADTYPALEYVVTQLGDSATLFYTADEMKDPNTYDGIWAFYPDLEMVYIDPGGPAERAGLQVGDILEAINGKPVSRFLGSEFLTTYDDRTIQVTVRREGKSQPITVTVKKVAYIEQKATGRRISTDQGSVGYIELPASGWDQYPTLAQQIIRKADQAGTCGWIIDLRRNHSGDIWSYIAAIGPILGEGEVGGFVYLDGRRETWKYSNGKVTWGKDERWESMVEGSIYELKHSMPPVAVLTSHITMAAGELAVVAFKGRSKVRTFGEPTGGSPFLVYGTGLSDGAWIGVSGAFSMDRTGRIYKGSIQPDEIAPTDWKLFRTDHDPVILAAQNWLLRQPDCAQN